MSKKLGRKPGKKPSSFRTRAGAIGISHPVLIRYEKYGIEPERRDLRARLKLPPLHTAPACQHCGAPPHAHRNCPARRNSHGKPRPPRIAIALDDPASAARSILAQRGPGYLADMAAYARRKWLVLSGEWLE